MKINDRAIVVGSIMILIASASRLLPHWHNFTAVGAVGLFAGFYFRKQVWAYLIPLISLWITDLVLNNFVYSAFQEAEFVWFSKWMIWVYLGFVMMVWVGKRIIVKVRPGQVLAGTVVASLAFFIISNFGSFLMDPMYPKSGVGLVSAYVAALPFFLNTILANIFYSALFFGFYASIPNFFPKYQAKNIS